MRVAGYAALCLWYGCGCSEPAAPPSDRPDADDHAVRDAWQSSSRQHQPRGSQVGLVVQPAAARVADGGARMDAGHMDSGLLPPEPDGGAPDAGAADASPSLDAGDGAMDAAMDAAAIPDVAIAKWFGNHTAAISLTFDGDPRSSPGVVELVAEHRLAFDCELVTGSLTPERIAYIETELIPNGITFFGHGEVHANHDKMSFEDALASASLCFEKMVALGLSPVSFAYPGGHGREVETRQAVAQAGFLSARFHTVVSNPYIVPGDTLEPAYWYALPDIVMESYDYRQAGDRVNDTAELIPFLDGALARTAWIILTYHSIGRPDLFGFYYLSDFASDLDEIEARDFWSAPMDAATLYVRERAGAFAEISRDVQAGELRSIRIYLDDGLPNDRYIQPLTLLFDVPPAWVGIPLAIEDDSGRWPDQVATSEHAALSFPPFEREFRVSPASSPYVPGDDSDAGP